MTNPIGTDALSTAIKVIFARLESLERDRTEMAKQIHTLQGGSPGLDNKGDTTSGKEQTE